MIEWKYIVAGCCVVLLTFLIWKEIHRENKARLFWRLLATVFAVAGFACIALPVKYSRSVTISTSGDAILLTEGFNADSVRHLLRSAQKDIPVLTLEEKFTTGEFQPAVVSNVNTESIFKKGISAVHVFGYGLMEEEIDQLQNRPIIFHPAKLSTGITSVHWNQKLQSGEKLIIQGTFNNTMSRSLKMVVNGFNTNLDSIPIPADRSYRFELTTVPKHAGRAVYSLVVSAGKDTLEQQLIPIHIEQGERLSVLILASAPDFENKFLKNWLAQNGYGVVTRTLISKNKFDKDFFNTDRYNIDRITSSLLSHFDILVADAAELSSISGAELSAIQSYVADKSLGLIVRNGSNTSQSFYSNHFPVTRIGGNEQQPFDLRLYDTSIQFQALSIDNPVSIRNQNATQPLITDRQNRIFVSSILYGSGKILFTTVNNTFSWALSGNQDDYENFWSGLMNKAAGKKQADESWSISPSLPQVDKETTIRVQTDQSTIPKALVAGTSVYLKNNPGLPFSWSGTYWPTTSGWQSSKQLNGNNYWWYVFNKSDWKTVSAFDKMQRTKQYELVNAYRDPAVKQSTQKEMVEFPKIYFFLVFLICCGFLWIERKFLIF